jgi:hypothetical protein
MDRSGIDSLLNFSIRLINFWEVLHSSSKPSRS